MKKKLIILISVLSVLLVASGIILNFVTKKIYVKNFKQNIKTEVLKKFSNPKYVFCYGNKISCKKLKYTVKGKVNNKKVGIYKLIYTATYKKDNYTKILNVNVVDTKKPVLKIEGEFKSVCPNGTASGVKVTATDNYDGDLTNKIKYKLVDKELTYVVKDSSGNKTTKTVKVTINDTEKPSIVLNGDPTMYMGQNTKYQEPGYAAVDNCDGDVTKNVKVSGGVDTSKSGSYTITYTIKDSFGNENSAKRTIKVFAVNKYSGEKSLGNKVIYLTFDDGPGPYTAQLLDILKKYNVKATFFVTSQRLTNGYENLLKREYDEGHMVAIHSYTHDYASIYSSLDAYMDDLLKMQDKIKQYTGYETKIVRFPGGSSNTISRKYKNGIMTEAANKLNELGFKYYDWNITSGDAGGTTNTNQIISNVTGAIKEGRPNMVLQHDIKSFSVNAVEAIIQYGLANGYTFAPITMETPAVHQGINN